MRALYYQPAAGIAGDMHLAALIDLGVPVEHITGGLTTLALSGEFDLTVAKASKMGISGTRVVVDCADQHDHRHHSTIVKLIEGTSLPHTVKQRALGMFEQIAVAEAKIHDIPVEQVHFHEVGAIDSIVDIVGAAIAIEYLQPDIILSAPIEVGSGYVNCAHGRFPVPAPATQEILRGKPCLYGGVDGESTTPTGAAILASNTDEFAPAGTFAPDRVGYGIGHKDFAVPNVLRVAIGDYQTGASSVQHYKIEANIDDMPAEAFEPLLNRLLDAGAGDAWCTPIVMKKSRPAVTLSVLAEAPLLDRLSNIVLNESSTIGLRVLPFTKTVLPRVLRTVATSLGDVGVKIVTQPDGRQRHKVEHEDVLRISSALGRDYQSVYREIAFDVRKSLDSEV